jgi:hypothetical protein
LLPPSQAYVQLTPPFPAWQLTCTPQLSVTVPHFPAQVVASLLRVQPHTPAVPPPPHELYPVQVPHDETLHVPTVTEPQLREPQSSALLLQSQESWFAAQVRSLAHVPHETVPPQLFEAVPHTFDPHWLTGVQPHWFATPPPPHVFGALHVTPPLAPLQVTVVPQLLVTLPHLPEQVVLVDSGTQMHWPLPLHVSGIVQVPHDATVQLPTVTPPHSRLPHSSCALSQTHESWFAAQLRSSGQVPHETVPPQPSDAVPHTFDPHWLAGVQPHWFAVPPPPHVWGDEHDTPPFAAEHETVWPQLLVTLPHFPPQVVPVGSGVQPQTFGTPPPPQVTPVPEQPPQPTGSPQLLFTVPHLPEQVALMLSGVHALQAPPVQPYWQVVSGCHAPAASQSSTPLPLQRRAPGEQTPPHVVPAQT